MSKFSLQVGAKDFDIKLDEDFYDYFIEDFKRNFGEKKNIGVQELLIAFVQKSYDEYLKEKEYMNLIEKIEKV